MAVNFEKLIEFCIDDVDDDKIIYFLHHCETNELGKVKAKTIGKKTAYARELNSIYPDPF